MDFFANADFNAILPRFIPDQNVSFRVCSNHWSLGNHLSLQVANLCSMLGLMFVISSLSMLLYLRVMLIASNLLMIAWSWFVACQMDVLGWNVLLLVVNIVHSQILIYRLHPLIRFPHEVEMIYRTMFAPLGMSRCQFNRLYRCSRGVQTIKSKDVYAFESQTIVDSLSLLLTGRVSIHKNGILKHLIDSGQFLESPEWFGLSGNTDKHQVTMVALEDSQMLVWNRDKLKLSISNDRYLQTMLEHILAKDILKKLMLSLDIETHSATEKTKLIAANYYPLNTTRDLYGNSCFWNITSMGINNTTNINADALTAPSFDVEANETAL